jgi:hypothetical protein
LACGNKEAVDMTHKLTAFILAQSKKNKELKKEKDKKEGKTIDKKAEKDSHDKKNKDSSAGNFICRDYCIFGLFFFQIDNEKSGSSSKKKSSVSKVVGDSGYVGENVFGIAEEDESDSKAAG